MNTKIEIRAMLAGLLVLGLVVLAQTVSDTKKAKKEPPPLNTAPYEVWTMGQLAKPGFLGRYDAPRHDCGESVDGWKPPTAALVPAAAKP